MTVKKNIVIRAKNQEAAKQQLKERYYKSSYFKKIVKYVRIESIKWMKAYGDDEKGRRDYYIEYNLHLN
jgi:hypothetical protein